MTTADELNDTARRTISITYEPFHESGAWPTYQYVDSCLRRSEGVNLRTVLKTMSREVINDPHGEQDVVKVTVRGLAALPEAAGDLELFLRALGWLVMRREAFRPSPTRYEELQVTSDEFVREEFQVGWQPSGKDLKVVSQMLLGEQLGVGGGWRDDPAAWTLSAPAGLLEYGGVTTIGDYVTRTPTITSYAGPSGWPSSASPDIEGESPASVQVDEPSPATVLQTSAAPTLLAGPPLQSASMPERFVDRPTYSQRHGRGPRSLPLSFAELRGYVASFVADLFAQDYLQEAFGYRCVDDGDVPGALGRDPDLFFQRRLGAPIMPIETTIQKMQADDLFDLIEVLHDLVSTGDEGTGRYHSFGNCGWHFRHFSAGPAQAYLREAINPLLRRLDPALELRSSGLLEEIGPEDLRPLVEAALPSSAPHHDVTKRVDAAVARFRHVHATIDDRKTAVRELADVLEFLRPKVKETMLPADEGALFQLANNFAIRHHNRSQRGDYDHLTWLSWAFYVYLATIHAVTAVMDRQTREGQ